MGLVYIWQFPLLSVDLRVNAMSAADVEGKAPEANLGEESEKKTEVGKEKKASVEGKVLVERGGEYVLVDEDDVAAQEMRQLVREADAEAEQTETKKKEKRRESDDESKAERAEPGSLGSGAQRARSARARSAGVRSPHKS